MPPVDQIPANDEGVARFNELMLRGAQTSLLWEAGRLPAVPELVGLTVEAGSIAMSPRTTKPVFTAVTPHPRGMTVNINYNAAQLSDGDARAVAASMQRLLREAAA